MGLFDKIKNALFEEEIVEVEEKPKNKKPKKELFKKEERPIAKKVVLPSKKEDKIEELNEEELIDEDFEIEPKKVPEEEKHDFKVMDDDDFKVDEEPQYTASEPEIVRVIDKEEPVKEEPHYYSGKADRKSYGVDDVRVSISEYGKNDNFSYSPVGAYEKKEDRTHFRPSPIISPIYGILDKNYHKEDVVTKKEVRLTSSYAREHVSVDDVRKKAYGSLSDDIVKELDEDNGQSTTFEVEKTEDANLLVDLSDDKEKPAVKEVTMGDALEYFEDLGLEYNVDYVDASKDKATGRRSKDNYDDKKDTLEETVEKPVVEEKEEKKPVEQKTTEVESDDNLFDLIDSMYKDHE